jgi:hypothetical protein
LNPNNATVVDVREGFQQTVSRPAPAPTAVLREVFELLEEYGPPWYTEEIHDRILAALSNDRSN